MAERVPSVWDDFEEEESSYRRPYPEDGGPEDEDEPTQQECDSCGDEGVLVLHGNDMLCMGCINASAAIAAERNAERRHLRGADNTKAFTERWDD